MLTNLLRIFGAPCTGGDFFGLPTWYKYLDSTTDANGKCVPSFDLSTPNSLWGIALAIAEMLLRVAALVAIGYIIYAGFIYMTSGGEAERAKNAKNTIINALVGLVISILAASIIAFVGNTIK